MSTQAKKSTEVAKKKQSEITQLVMRKVDAFQKSGEIKLPSDYSPENALKSAQLVLQEQTDKNGTPVLQSCTRSSIGNALLKTIVWGLSPMKGQVYYIPYGKSLECSISYAGNIAIAKRYGELKSIKGNCIMKGDDFEFEIDSTTGHRKIVTHKQTLESIGSEQIVGAYAVYELNDGSIDVEIMNMKQIEKSWNQRKGNGLSPAHKNFPDQMAIKTVINRACKLLIRGSDDAVLYDQEDKNLDKTKADVDQEIEDNANDEFIDIESEEVEEPKDVKNVEVKAEEVKADKKEQPEQKSGKDEKLF